MTKTLVQQARVKTNTTKGSVCKINIETIKFSKLWAAYPDFSPCDAKDEEGRALFSNQCAIRVGYALKKAGVTFKSYPVKRKCWVHPTDDHVLAATELAEWLELQPFVGCKKSENVTGKDWETKVNGRTGIIYFENYWSRNDDSSASPTGDHIDLWNKSTLTPSAESFFRFTLGINRPWFNPYSDLRNAKKILFFEIKS